MREILVKEQAELHLFDFNSGFFILQDPFIVATVSETGTWQYWLQITGSEKEWLGQQVVADLSGLDSLNGLWLESSLTCLLAKAWESA